MGLEPADLNDLDESILDYLGRVGRATPSLFKRDRAIDTSRQWVSSRFVRLAEHDHIADLHDTGVYELVDDPRDDVDEEDDAEDKLEAARDAHQDLIDARERVDQESIEAALERLGRALEVNDG